MCGIVGLFAKSPAIEDRLGEHLAAMLRQMSDRGPDSAGVAVYRDPVAHGHSKLVLCTPNAPIVLSPLVNRNLPYDAAALEPIIGLAQSFFVVAVRKDFPAESIAELITHAKANPNKINYASGGTGSGSYFATLLFARSAGIEMVNIPYLGSAPAQQALVALLNGDQSGAVSLQDGQVVLDLSDVIDQVKSRLVARGLTFVENAPIPTIDKQIVILDAPQADQLRTIYAFTNPVAKWLIVVVAALYLAALLLARRRPRMAVTIGVGLALNGLIVAFALSIARSV
jgi:hypothetical protein